jgi:ABC-type transport system involved in multi-copper enzyme maturation permease subunit
MTARTMTLERGGSRRAMPLLGVGTAARKEATEWLRSPKALVIAGFSIVGAVFMTLVPIIAELTHDAGPAGLITRDPTANVLSALAGQTAAVIAILATMTLITVEHDRGTLAWSLSNPVSPTSILAAKTVVATAILAATTVALPLVVSYGVASAVYGTPDAGAVLRFGALYLAVPVFYVVLTVAFGTAIRSTAGVAGAAIAVMLVVPGIGQLVPLVNELSPTSMATWALAVATGHPASMLTPAAWAVATVAIAIVGARVFARLEH